ncbi:MAG: hypothetical protein ABEI75_00080, partial [Halobaculum sp.]
RTTTDRTTTDRTVADRVVLRLRNELEYALTVSVEVSSVETDRTVLDDQYDVVSGGTRRVTVDGQPTFRVAVWMVDGPVESIFGHRWDATESLTVVCHENGIDFA